MSLKQSAKNVVKIVRSGSYSTDDILKQFGYHGDEKWDLSFSQLDTILVSMANTMSEIAKTSNIDLRK